MTSRNVFNAMRSIDVQLILDAAPTEKVKKNNKALWFKWGAVAACFCLAIMGAFSIAIGFIPSQATDHYREGNMIEISSINELPAEYNGTLLAENIEFSKAEFYYDTDGTAENIEDWYSLLISKGTSEYRMTMFCLFGDSTVDDWKVSRVFTRKATETININGVDVQIARNEISLQYEYWYYAIFEYDDVVYDIRVKSNDANCVYEVLNTVLQSR